MALLNFFIWKIETFTAVHGKKWLQSWIKCEKLDMLRVDIPSQKVRCRLNLIQRTSVANGFTAEFNKTLDMNILRNP